MLICRTPVRIAFAGGGTDFPEFYERYGGAVVSTTIDKYFYTVVTERDDDHIHVISSDLRAMERIDSLDFDRYDGDLRIPLAVVDHLQFRRGVNLFMASEIPPGTGLGSSASVCVNILRALCELDQRPIDDHELAEQAYHIAREVMKAPVGKQDEYAAAFGGLNEIRFRREGTVVEPLRVSSGTRRALESRLLLYFTGSSRTSYEILAEQKRSSARREADVIEALCGIRDLVTACRQTLEAGDLDGFGEVLHQGWLHKRNVSRKITSDAIDHAYETARDAGALGGKIAGAGGGGFMMLFCRAGAQDSVRAAMRGVGLKEMSYHFDERGSHVLTHDPFFDSSGRGATLWRYEAVAV